MTIYNDMISYDLARDAIKGLLVKTALDPSLVDYVLMGTVVQEVVCFASRVYLFLNRGYESKLMSNYY